MDAPDARIEGRLVGDLALIPDGPARHELELRGYGEESEGRFLLKPFESLYLLHTGGLRLRRLGREVGFAAMMRLCRRTDEMALARFLIYRDLRERGYTVKDGFGFGADFRVYDQGQFGKKAARYVVFDLSEGTRERVGDLQKRTDQIARMGKEPIIAVIESRGEVIYYKVSRIRFPRNKGAETVRF